MIPTNVKRSNRIAAGRPWALSLAGCLLIFAATSLAVTAPADRPRTESAQPEAFGGGSEPRHATMTPIPIVAEGLESIGPPPGGRPAPAYPQSPAMSLDQDGDQIGAVLAPSPAGPEGTIPGVCTGGAEPPNTPCTVPANCNMGGTCTFYRTEVYRNEVGLFGYTTCTTGPNCPTYLDDFTLASAISFPPARITSVEIGWVTRAGRAAAPGQCFVGGAACTSNAACGGATPSCTTLPTGKTLRVEVRFWNTLDDTVPTDPVNTGFLGGFAFNVPGPLSAGTGTQTGLAYVNTVVLPFATAIAPDHLADHGIQLDFRDGTNPNPPFPFTTAGSPLFAGTGVTTGSSFDVFWDDDNADGTFQGNEGFNFGGGAFKANSYAHLGAELPTSETEPNNSQVTATDTAFCLALTAAISPVADVDWYRFSTSSAQTVISEVSCGNAANDSTLTLRNSVGMQIGFNDDVGGGNLCSKITSNLAAGTYFLEVHEKGDNAVIPSYTMGVGPPPAVVTGLTIGAQCNPTCTDKHTIAWGAVAGAAPYDIIYGDLQTLHSSGLNASMLGGLGGCLGDNLPNPASDDGDSPAAGQGFWYLSRSRNVCTHGAGTYDSGGAGQVAPRDPLIPISADCSRP